MPIYEYTCPTHGAYEKLVSRSDESTPQKCPECGSVNPRHEISQSSFVLNGAWFKTKGTY